MTVEEIKKKIEELREDVCPSPFYDDDWIKGYERGKESAYKDCLELLDRLETTATKEKEQEICGNCKWCHEGHYEAEGEEPCIKRSCLSKYGLAKGFSVYIDDFCSRWEGKEE